MKHNGDVDSYLTQFGIKTLDVGVDGPEEFLSDDYHAVVAQPEILRSNMGEEVSVNSSFHHQNVWLAWGNFQVLN